MDQLLNWLDGNALFARLGHAWPWAAITAFLAAATLIGIVNLARRYGDRHTAHAD